MKSVGGCGPGCTEEGSGDRDRKGCLSFAVIFSKEWPKPRRRGRKRESGETTIKTDAKKSN